MSGYIKDYRQELNSDIWMMPPLYHRVWQYIKYKANHSDATIPMRDGSKLEIKSGQHVTSLSIIAENVAWYERGILKIPNKKTIQSILKWLEESNMIYTGESNGKYTMINVVNWGIYQGSDYVEVTENTQPKVTVSKRSLDTNNNDNNKQEDNKKDSCPKRVYDIDSEPYIIAKFLRDKILEWKPNAKVPKETVEGLNKWSNDIRMMMEIDRRDKSDICKIIAFATKDAFWRSNVLSASKLRDKYDQLEAKMNELKPIKKEEPKKPTTSIYDSESYYADKFGQNW